ncbi:MAG: MBL fold metallo-hydrolase [Candidatus Omnitrophota bacterium]|nr:MBL fold metallo-hydrolase [Candidatus Omnitrophota bacterium]
MAVLNNNLTLKTIVVGPMAVNCYIVSDKSTKNAFIVDPGDDFGDINRYLDSNKLRPQFIIHTHGHYDHIGADSDFNLPIYIHKLDRDCLSDAQKNLSGFFGYPFKLTEKQINTLEDGSEIKFGDSVLKIIHIPGHTAGGIGILLDEALFSGDTLFAFGIGRTDFPGASGDLLISSIREKLFKLADNIVVYPGHGEPTTIGKEKEGNPFLMSP